MSSEARGSVPSASLKMPFMVIRLVDPWSENGFNRMNYAEFSFLLLYGIDII